MEILGLILLFLGLVLIWEVAKMFSNSHKIISAIILISLWLIGVAISSMGINLISGVPITQIF